MIQRSDSKRPVFSSVLLSILLSGMVGSISPAWSTRHAVGPVSETDLSHLFEGVDPEDATFVLLRDSDGSTVYYNAERARQRFIPASTFKIPNSLIALETGVVDSPDFVLQWDPRLKPETGFWAASWSKNHTLRSAIADSVYWYYQELARRIGREQMQDYLDRFDYGNRDTSGDINTFWLHGNLRISPHEQTLFLHRLLNGKLPVSEKAVEVIKEILVLEDTPEYRLSGKTGTAGLTATRELLWLVGYLEHSDDRWIFALNLEGEEAWERWGNPTERRHLVVRLLRDLKVIP